MDVRPAVKILLYLTPPSQPTGKDKLLFEKRNLKQPPLFLQFIPTYLRAVAFSLHAKYILKMRMEERLAYLISIPEGLSSAAFPTMIPQKN